MVSGNSDDYDRVTLFTFRELSAVRCWPRLVCVGRKSSCWLLAVMTLMLTLADTDCNVDVGNGCGTYFSLLCCV